MGRDWPWNPIESGDIFGNPSRILSFVQTSETMEISIIPKQVILLIFLFFLEKILIYFLVGL